MNTAFVKMAMAKNRSNQGLAMRAWKKCIPRSIERAVHPMWVRAQPRELLQWNMWALTGSCYLQRAHFIPKGMKNQEHHVISCWIIQSLFHLNPFDTYRIQCSTHPLQRPVSIVTFRLTEFAMGLGLLSIHISSFLTQLFINTRQRTEELRRGCQFGLRRKSETVGLCWVAVGLLNQCCRFGWA